jgi:CBS domain-containing protein
LKRLALVKVSEIEVEGGPVLAPSATVEEARKRMAEFETNWVSVIEDGELRGWVDEAALEGKSTVGQAEARRFSAYVTADSSLRQALDSIVTSRTQVAVVVESGQRYRGILTLERISREIIA